MLMTYKAAGVPEKQAEVQTHIFAEVIKEQNQAINNLIDNSLATKQDLKELELLLKRDTKELELKIEQVRVELKRDIKELENKLIIKLGALLGSIMLGGMALLQYLK
ncbi:conserved hypothetical protein [Gammaproteobacteria bacterium]